MNTKNGIATHPGACALITASTPWFEASGASIVGSRSPKRPSRSIGIVTPASGQKVTARVQLGAGLRRDHAVDREPADGEEERQSRSQVRAAYTEDPPREDDLRKARARTCVAEQAEDHGRRSGPDGCGGKTVPDTQTVVSREQARREEARVVDEGAPPPKSKLARPALAPLPPDRLDPLPLYLAANGGGGPSGGGLPPD